MQGAIPAQLHVGGQKCTATWGIDLYVDPQWRGTRVAEAVWRARRQSGRVGCSLGMSDAGHRFSIRMGSTEMGSMPMYLHLLDPHAYRRWKGATSTTGRAAAPLVAGAVRLGRMVSRAASARVEHLLVAAFDERADLIWNDAKAAYGVLVRRDAAWLRWRFDQCPDLEDVSRYYLTRANQPVGYVVLRPSTWHDQPALEIIDYLARPEHLASLFGSAVRIATEHGAVALTCYTMNAHAKTALRLLGFAKRAVALRFMVHTAPDDPQRRTLLEPRNWFLTAADSDAI
jgi:hypothetical protein